MKATKTVLGTIFTLTFALGQLGCNTMRGPEGSRSAEANDDSVQMAVAHLQPTAGNEAEGIVTFTKVADGIQVSAHIQGLETGPKKRGFHIHEFGDCSAPDGTSAGGHFNPQGMPHGAPEGDKRHAGDFGNLSVDEDGNARTEFIDTNISFEGPNSILGRAVIVHAQQDDLQSQPTGDAGARVACGVIQAVE